MTEAQGFSDKVGLIWSVADLLRGDVKQHEYGSYILPFIVLRWPATLNDKKAATASSTTAMPIHKYVMASPLSLTG